MTLHALVLAAGAGRRFGGGKLLADYRGHPLVTHALAAAFAAPVISVRLVIGCDGAAVAQTARAWAKRKQHDLSLVEGLDWTDGMAASLRAGIASLPSDATGAFVFLGDMPDIPRAVLRPLAAAVHSGAPAAAPVFGAQRAHPVLLAREALALAELLEGDRGAAPVLARLGLRVAHVPTENPGVLRDVDYLADLPDAPEQPIEEIAI
jgi:molybdenum cofactor cytidylyltransferase